MTIARGLIAGVAGAATTNVFHELLRRSLPNAPRIDLLGMQAMAKMYRASGSDSPTGKTLYTRTLIGDLISNTAYFSLVSVAPPSGRVVTGVVLGLLAGIGAVVLPPQLALSAEPTARTPVTSGLTVMLYTAGGIVAGLVASSNSSDEPTPEQTFETPQNIVRPVIDSGVLPADTSLEMSIADVDARPVDTDIPIGASTHAATANGFESSGITLADGPGDVPLPPLVTSAETAPAISSSAASESEPTHPSASGIAMPPLDVAPETKPAM